MTAVSSPEKVGASRNEFRLFWEYPLIKKNDVFEIESQAVDIRPDILSAMCLV